MKIRIELRLENRQGVITTREFDDVKITQEELELIVIPNVKATIENSLKQIGKMHTLKNHNPPLDCLTPFLMPEGDYEPESD